MKYTKAHISLYDKHTYFPQYGILEMERQKKMLTNLSLCGVVQNLYSSMS
jgi:hypothetical protein